MSELPKEYAGAREIENIPSLDDISDFYVYPWCFSDIPCKHYVYFVLKNELGMVKCKIKSLYIKQLYLHFNRDVPEHYNFRSFDVDDEEETDMCGKKYFCFQISTII